MNQKIHKQLLGKFIMPEPAFSKFAEGFMVGIGLFSALGPKDSFILQQSLSKRTNWSVVWLFIFADIVLIAIGTAGFGSYLEKNKRTLSLIILGSILYLIWFGLSRLLAALGNRSSPMNLANDLSNSALFAPRVLRTAMMLSFANPYAWIDTVLIIGVLAGAQIQTDKIVFAIGSMCASLVWFNALTLGSAQFSPLFQGRWAWRILDMLTAVVMFYFAAMLAFEVHWRAF
ncbi:MAG: LysE family transporter [Burkholderiaceae bacterium]|nr:LysE family transporter [Burkholderiaceae bacterium]